MKVWITRDIGTTIDKSCIWKLGYGRRPVNSHGVFVRGKGGDLCKGMIVSLYTKQAKKLLGFTPRKGSCKQMELSLTEIE